MVTDGFSPDSILAVQQMLYGELDWGKQFQTGKSPGPENPENYHTGLNTKKGRGQLKIGKGPGDGWKQKNNESEMLSGPALEKGPGNPQSGSSKEVTGMRMLG